MISQDPQLHLCRSSGTASADRMRSAASQLCGLSRIAYALSHYPRHSVPDMAGVVPDKARAVIWDKISSQHIVTAQSLALSDFADVVPSAVTSCAIKPYTRARAPIYFSFFSQVLIYQFLSQLVTCHSFGSFWLSRSTGKPSTHAASHIISLDERNE